MRGLDPRIHLLRKKFYKVDGLPGHKRVYARLQRAMPGNDDLQFAPMRFRGNERTKSPSLRRNDAQALGLALRTRLVAPEPDLHAVEIEINYRRGVERQELAQREAANHGVAERLEQLRTRARAAPHQQPHEQ